MNSQSKKIAIIGSGISGQSAGYLLSRKHQVTLFEANDYLGGHTATVDVELDGKQLAIDTGFIVFNDRTYPNFIKLMTHLDIDIQPTEMSFSVHNHANGLEYNGHNIDTLFAQRRNLFNPRFYGFIKEILRFNKLAKKADAGVLTGSNETLGSFLDKHDFGDYFANNYILAMVSAIWSSSINGCREFPLSIFLQFFNNHGLLDINNRPQWYVIKGGSRSYIPHLIRPIQDVRLNSPVLSVARQEHKVTVVMADYCEQFDEVIFACHADQALALLDDPSIQEKAVLGRLVYRENEVVLHTDTALLPRRKKAIASWNYWIDSDSNDLPCVTYDMNILQGLDVGENVFVTLNKTQSIDPDKILRRFSYSHPVITLESISAQAKRAEICGINHTHFCGAYWYNGFHEDGLRSALDVCQRFGAEL
ncbi:NAD(P)/FAD-dependent oxidoreductase [Dasania marina]|uniref:NAD(P)/FAD-dependent oxidoreductase n=1 Tax=Dasania marina TaxID=471499 RepID=UPI000366C2AF|nr:FAD-dependent oxidoreductase [Dasania marina]